MLDSDDYLFNDCLKGLVKLLHTKSYDVIICKFIGEYFPYSNKGLFEYSNNASNKNIINFINFLHFCFIYIPNALPNVLLCIVERYVVFRL